MISDYLEKSPDYGPKAYKCTVCGKVSSDKSSASKHVENIHMQGVFNYTCKHCGKTFGSRNNMYAHISRTHKNSFWSLNANWNIYRQDKVALMLKPIALYC